MASQHADKLEDVAIIARAIPGLEVKKGFKSYERRLVAKLQPTKTRETACFAPCFGAMFAAKTSQKLMTVLPDGVVEREKEIVLKHNQGLVTFFNHQKTTETTDALRNNFRDPYVYKIKQGGRETDGVVQAWTITYDKGFADRCANTGIAPTIVDQDEAALKAAFESAPAFCGGRTPQACVAKARERAECFKKVVSHVVPRGEQPGPVMLCALKTEVNSPLFVGSVQQVFDFLARPAVQEALRVRRGCVDPANRTVTFESVDKGGNLQTDSPQVFTFSSVSQEQRLVVYERTGRRIFYCVKLEEQFLEEGEYLV